MPKGFQKGRIPWNKGRFGKPRAGNPENWKHSIKSKKKMSEAHKLIGDRPPSRLGSEASEATKKKMSRAHQGVKMPPRTEQWYRKQKESHTGKKRSPHTEATRQKMREIRINNPTNKFFNTSIELKMKSILDAMKTNYLFQHPLEKIARVDFFLPEHKLVIQCDGCYWHGCPIHFPEMKTDNRDEIQDSKLTALGYKVIRFWEHEINNMIVLNI